MERDEATPELTVEITDKLSHTPLENASWHEDVEQKGLQLHQPLQKWRKQQKQN